MAPLHRTSKTSEATIKSWEKHQKIRSRNTMMRARGRNNRKEAADKIILAKRAERAKAAAAQILLDKKTAQNKNVKDIRADDEDHRIELYNLANSIDSDTFAQAYDKKLNPRGMKEGRTSHGATMVLKATHKKLTELLEGAREADFDERRRLELQNLANSIDPEVYAKAFDETLYPDGNEGDRVCHGATIVLKATHKKLTELLEDVREAEFDEHRRLELHNLANSIASEVYVKAFDETLYPDGNEGDRVCHGATMVLKATHQKAHELYDDWEGRYKRLEEANKKYEAKAEEEKTKKLKAEEAQEKMKAVCKELLTINRELGADNNILTANNKSLKESRVEYFRELDAKIERLDRLERAKFVWKAERAELRKEVERLERADVDWKDERAELVKENVELAKEKAEWKKLAGEASTWMTKARTLGQQG